MRWLIPKSLGGQLAALLVLGLLFANVASLLIFSGERSRAVNVAVQFGLVERIAALAEIIDDAPPDIGNRLATALSTRRTQIRIDTASSLPEGGMSDVEAEFSAELADELDLSAQQPRVRFIEEERPGNRGFRRRALTEVTISIPLNDGRWLNAQSWFGTPRIRWSWPWLISLLASAVVTLVVTAFVVGRITRPMRALAAAAERVGRGETVTIAPPAGPVEVRTTVQAFNDMTARLSRFVRDRTQMIAAISHDLRTPITSLRLRAEFIEDETLKQDVVRTLDEMQAMAEATLKFAREESSGEETRSVDIAALIDGLVDDQVALGHSVSYQGPERLIWRCRPVSLKRAIANLLENAVRYAGSACVSLSESDGFAVIAVDDEGPGIPEAMIEEVFEPFVRLESSRSRDTGGAGLGLAIARSVIHAHGGDLSLENKSEGGLRASVKLP